MNQQLIAIMRKYRIPVYSNMTLSDDPELRAQQIVSAINDTMTCAEVIAINTQGERLPQHISPLLYEFLESDGPISKKLNALGEYLYSHMPPMA